MLCVVIWFVYTSKSAERRFDSGKASLACRLLSHGRRMTGRDCEASAGRFTGAGTCANQQQSVRPWFSRRACEA